MAARAKLCQNPCLNATAAALDHTMPLGTAGSCNMATAVATAKTDGSPVLY
jgi:hypothetical protein